MTEQELVNEIIKLASELDRGDITPDDITIKAENLVRTDRYDQLILSGVIERLNVSDIPAFEDWLVLHECKQTITETMFMKNGYSYDLRELKRWYEESFNI